MRRGGDRFGVGDTQSSSGRARFSAGKPKFGRGKARFGANKPQASPREHAVPEALRLAALQLPLRRGRPPPPLTPLYPGGATTSTPQLPFRGRRRRSGMVGR